MRMDDASGSHSRETTIRWMTYTDGETDTREGDQASKFEFVVQVQVQTRWNGMQRRQWYLARGGSDRLFEV
jgi:hypothetical protein